MLRFPVFLLCSFLISAPLAGQAEVTDPYSIKFVEQNLHAASTTSGEWAGAGKDFQRLGDGISIALLKILGQQDLTKPEVVKRFLPLIRQSFSYPSIISIQADKDPKVTLFLLGYLENNLSDLGVRQEVRETISFVNQKTAK